MAIFFFLVGMEIKHEIVRGARTSAGEKECLARQYSPFNDNCEI
jgi:Na+/H+ antiporter NhaA